MAKHAQAPRGGFRPVRTISARQLLKHDAGETVYVRLEGEFREEHRKTHKRVTDKNPEGGEGDAKSLLVEVTNMQDGSGPYDYPVTVQTRKAITDNYKGSDYVGRIFAISKEAVGEGKGVRYATSITEVEAD